MRQTSMTEEQQHVWTAPVESDPETRELFLLATANFARLRSTEGFDRRIHVGPAHSADPKETVVPMIVLLVVFVLAFAFRTPTGKQEGGRVADASRFVHTQARGGSDGRFLITSVSRPGFGDPQLSSARIAMRASQKSAIAAASDCLRPRTAISATISSEGLTGGSAGLMFALTVVDAHDTSDLTRGRRIAGTGTILEDGAVGPVLHVGVKARAAERAGADLFLVPETQIVQARSATDSMPVAGVRTLDEAVRVLTGSGCSR